MNQTILVVEDDPKTANLIRLYLEGAQYAVINVYDGNEALEIARQQAPDLIVLDLMLPGLDGLTICKTLRAESEIPIIVLTARSTESDVLLGLELGADDYVTKPFSPREIVARVRTVLRRTTGSVDNDSLWQHGQLIIDVSRHEVRLQDEPVRLTPKEFKLLEILARTPGRVFSRMELVEKAFGYDYEGMERTVDAHIMNLRKKIEVDHTQPDYIETVYGIGYRFAES